MKEFYAIKLKINIILKFINLYINSCVNNVLIFLRRTFYFFIYKKIHILIKRKNIICKNSTYFKNNLMFLHTSSSAYLHL